MTRQSRAEIRERILLDAKDIYNETHPSDEPIRKTEFLEALEESADTYRENAIMNTSEDISEEEVLHITTIESVTKELILEHSNVKNEPIMNKATEQAVKHMIRERMLNMAKEAYEDNPMKGTPFEGMLIRSAIATASKNYKEAFMEERDKLGLSEEEVNQMVDDVTSELLDELFE